MSSQNLPLQMVIINEVFFQKSENDRDQKNDISYLQWFSLEGYLSDTEFQAIR